MMDECLGVFGIEFVLIERRINFSALAVSDKNIHLIKKMLMSVLLGK